MNIKEFRRLSHRLDRELARLLVKKTITSIFKDQIVMILRERIKNEKMIIDLFELKAKIG